MYPSTRKIKMLIADDQELVRSGYKAIFDTFPDLDVVGVATDGAQAVELASTLKPDVVLMDIRMPNKNGIEATRDITSNPMLKDTHVLVLTTFDLDQYVYDALVAGASGFLLKDADPDEIANAVRVVARGDALIQPSVMARMIEKFVDARLKNGQAHAKNEAAQHEALATLTEREREILVLVARGLTNEEIGKELFISPATVKTHTARIMAKTDSHDRAQLVVFAYETGLVHA
jgi:RNA polymerase sigma factor (sigma-70 family)